MKIDMGKIRDMVEEDLGLFAEELTTIMAAEGGTLYSALNSCLIDGIVSKYKEILMIEEMAREAGEE